MLWIPNRHDQLPHFIKNSDQSPLTTLSQYHRNNLLSGVLRGKTWSLRKRREHIGMPGVRGHCSGIMEAPTINLTSPVDPAICRNSLFHATSDVLHHSYPQHVTSPIVGPRISFISNTQIYIVSSGHQNASRLYSADDVWTIPPFLLRYQYYFKKTNTRSFF